MYVEDLESGCILTTIPRTINCLWYVGDVLVIVPQRSQCA